MADILRKLKSSIRFCVPGLFVLAYVLQITAINTKFWTFDAHNGHSGLWTSCDCTDQEHCQCTGWSFKDLPMWFVSVITLESIGLVGLTASSLLVLLEVSTERIRNTSILLLTFLSGLLILGGIITFAAKMNIYGKRIGYSFYLSAMSGVMSILLTLVYCAEVCASQRQVLNRTQQGHRNQQ